MPPGKYPFNFKLILLNTGHLAVEHNEPKALIICTVAL